MVTRAKCLIVVATVLGCGGPAEPSGARTTPTTPRITSDAGGVSDGAHDQRLKPADAFIVMNPRLAELQACLIDEDHVSVTMVVDGPSGRISSFEVDGKPSGAVHDCMGRVLSELRFPAGAGPSSLGLDISK
jgi:hypothetical protein